MECKQAWKIHAQKYREKNAKAVLGQYVRHKLNESEARELVRTKGGKCEICKTNRSRLVIDHDHRTGEIRGVLCHNCNAGIGMLKDRLETVRDAAYYLFKCRNPNHKLNYTLLNNKEND